MLVREGAGTEVVCRMVRCGVFAVFVGEANIL